MAPPGGPTDLVPASSSKEHAIIAPVSHLAEHRTTPDFGIIFASPSNTQMALLHALWYGPLIQLLLLTLLLLMILFGDGLWMMSIVLSLKILLGTLFLLDLA
jgi:hypothetical protein